MPELPEVELCRRSLARWTASRIVVAVHVPDPAVVRGRLTTRPDGALVDGVARLQGLVGGRVVGLSRRGKRLGIQVNISDESVFFVVHLGMTGRWVRREDDQPQRHGRLALRVDDGSVLWFEDPRRFGCVVPVTDLADALADGVGPDALDADLSATALRDALLGPRGRCRAAVKVSLMDQKKLAGMGNIQATEALWRAGLPPDRATEALDDDQWRALALAIRWTLLRTLDMEGDDEVVYLSAGGRNPFLIYGRAGEPCPTCAEPIRTCRLGGRVTSFCGKCQSISA
ncbi:MAG: formamidopyrimidine-DNA glycosylase [Kiritimatiellia bacterium]|jgi:formamidopyrimidine-DNA glycosylase